MYTYTILYYNMMLCYDTCTLPFASTALRSARMSASSR